MSVYRAAIDFDKPLANLVNLSPQPRSTGVQPTRRTFTGNSILDEGLYCELIWDGGIDDATQYRGILGYFGLHNATYRPVTIYARNDLFEWIRYNGIAVRPEPVWEAYFPRLTVLIRDLQEIG
jgi:hypothetical protein